MSFVRPLKNFANPALRPLEFLVGDWDTIGAHPHFPGESLRGKTAFSWHLGGAFLLMRSQVDHPLFPAGLAIIGSDDAADRFSMIYFDERGTSRLLDVTVEAQKVSWKRDDPDFSQSLTIKAEQGGERLVSTGRMSRKRGEWEDDLSQVFTRASSQA